MKITIVIPTYKRIEKLDRCLVSIFNQTYKNFDIYVMPDNDDIKSHKYIQDHYPQVLSFYTNTHKYGPGSWQWFLSNKFDNVGDIFLGLVDDCELHADCLQELVWCFEYLFSGTTNCAIGLSQECPGSNNYKWKEFGIMAIGRKLLENFPNQRIVCPDYKFLYQDQEFYNFLKKNNKFSLSTNAILNHYHPNQLPNEKDATHYLSRGNIAIADKKTYEKRQELGLIWGESFETINTEEKK